MHATHDPRTVAGGDAATIADAPAGDHTSAVAAIGPATSAMLGREILGQYRVLSKLGRGGMGTVFLAEQMGMQRQVAIKVLHADISEDPDAARRFQVEAQAAARLQSPNIVSVFNFGQLDSGELYLAMEYLQGRSLQDEIATYGQLAIGRVLSIVGQLGRGLDEAHRNGVVHRDLKPGNVMLVPHAEGEVVKILDFGIAKVDAGSSTQTRGWVGTPRYMAPEQFTGAPVDARTDVYALGLIAYEMLCGRTPFVSDNPMSYVHSHVYAEVPSLQQVAPGQVPPAVEAVVLSALSKVPSQRPPSAGAFFGALQQSLHAPPPRKRSAAPAIVAAVLGVLAVGGGGAWAYSRWGEGEAAPEVASTPSSNEATPDTPSSGFDPEYVSRLPPEYRALLEEDEDALLLRLDQALEAVPPSMRKQTRSQYTLQLAAMPQAAASRKAMLVQTIVALGAAENHVLRDERSTDELVRAYLDSPGPIPRADRQSIIDGMRTAQTNPEDADWVLRQWLLQLEAQKPSK